MAIARCRQVTLEECDHSKDDAARHSDPMETSRKISGKWHQRLEPRRASDLWVVARIALTLPLAEPYQCRGLSYSPEGYKRWHPEGAGSASEGWYTRESGEPGGSADAWLIPL